MPLLRVLREVYRNSRFPDLYRKNSGLGLLKVSPASSLLPVPFRRGYLRPWRSLLASDSGVSSIQSDDKEFRINLDVQQFKPEELKVKVADGFIVVHGKHEETSDEHGFISRQFTRKYKIPRDVDESSLVSNLSSDGVLIVKAPKKGLPQPKEKEIPIVRTNQPALKQKETNRADKMEQ